MAGSNLGSLVIFSTRAIKMDNPLGILIMFLREVFSVGPAFYNCVLSYLTTNAIEFEGDLALIQTSVLLI